MKTALASLLLLLTTGSVAWADAPMSLLQTASEKNHALTPLNIGLLVISIVVIVVIAVAVALGLPRNGMLDREELAGGLAVARPGGAVMWIYIGVGVTVAVLLGSLIWSMVVLARTSSPPRAPGLTIDITGHQWWWEVRYNGQAPSDIFKTANEIHIPTGVPVRLKLHSADVIHSFWVPALSGKTDLIPGQTNEAWFDAKAPGRFWGQCAEFCGAQHAHMALLVVAQKPEDFEQWRQQQLEPSPPPFAAEAITGSQRFVQRCGSCHTVRGTPAGGIYGPDLSHLAQRYGLAAETIPNTPGHLAAWIADPQTIKPGNQMPVLNLPGPEQAQIRAYLQTLK